MGHFVRHTSCDSCGSSDAKALYSDGGTYCYSCKKATKPSFVAKIQQGNVPPKPGRQLPDNLSTHFQGKAVEWLTKYGFSIETLIRHGVRYANNWVYFTWPNTDVWQARDMDRKRYFTSGAHDTTLLLYYCGVPVERCILTEDCLSAIKIASGRPLNGSTIDAMPLLGTSLPASKLRSLKRLYSRVDVFLDHDKAKEAMNLSNRIKLIGLDSRVYINPLDPKELSYDTLREILSMEN